VRLEKIENNTKVYDFDWFYDFIDYGEFYLLTELRNMKSRTVMITLNQNTTLEDIQEKYGGYLEYHKLCKTTFRMYVAEEGELYSHDIDEVVNWNKIGPFEYFPCRVLKALITGGGLEELNARDHFIRWPNENGGRGEHWYWLLKN
jgi:hypothetical protein